MSARVLLVNPRENAEPATEMYPSGALVLLGTMLGECGHEVTIVHMTADGVDLEGLGERVRQFRPDIVGITVNSYQTRSARAVATAVKSVSRDILVAAGGPHPSALKADLLADFPDVDAAVVGEGEFTFLDIVEGRPLADIPGLCTRDGVNPPRPHAESLDHIPLPNLDLVAHLDRFVPPRPVKARPSLYVMASRGCPFDCTFCNKSVWGHKVRFREPEQVVREVEWLHTRYGACEIYFQDDTFNLRRAWTVAVFESIIAGGLHRKVAFRMPWRADERLVDAELLRLARRAGVWLIFYGVESGNQRVLDLMKKQITVPEIERAFRLTHEAGIKTYASFMVGNLGETRESVADSIALAQRIHPAYGGVALAIPFPGSELRTVLAQKGQLLDPNCDHYTPSSCVVRTDELTADDLVALHEQLAAALLPPKRGGLFRLFRKLRRSVRKRLGRRP